MILISAEFIKSLFKISSITVFHINYIMVISCLDRAVTKLVIFNRRVKEN